MTTIDSIGARIRYWRLRRGGMTQSVLAGLSGVSQSYISQVEAGRKGIERRSTLVGIAAALQVTVADLLGQPGDPTDPVKAGAGEHGRVIEVARAVRPDALRAANRHQSYRLDLGRAHARSGRSDQKALVAFRHAERAAPASFAMNPLARDAVSAMVRRAQRRSVSRDLQIAARRLGVDVGA
jgi:transcriptional regulator with XRE-family HTH domain